MIDVTEWRDFAKSLRKAAPDVAKNLRINLRAVGEIVAADARDRVSDVSNSIPPSIRVRTAGASVKVVAGVGLDTPLAGLFEEGNKGKRSGGDTFRHPVFGNMNVWVDQATHPYLEPAATAHEAEVAEALGMAFDKAVDEIPLVTRVHWMVTH